MPITDSHEALCARRDVVTREVYELIDELKLEVARAGEGWKGDEKDRAELLRRMTARVKLRELVDMLRLRRLTGA